MPKPPNILLVMADQMRFDALGVETPTLRTPHLDRLAREGLRCTRAYAPTAVCLPCRASVVTGQYPSSHGAMHNLAALSEDHPVLLPKLLSRAGYYTHLIGKSHFSPCHDPVSREGAPHIHNLNHWRRWHGPWYGFERADLSIGHTIEPHGAGMHYGAWLADRGVDRQRYFGRHKGAGSDDWYTAFGVWDLPAEHHQSAWVAETAMAAIDRAAGRERPFFIWANFADPHNPCMVPEPWASMYDPAALPRYGFKPGEPACFAQKPPFYQEILDRPGAYQARPSDPDLPGAGNVCSLGWDEATVQRHAAAYHGMVALMDHHLGRILAHLDATDLARETVVVFTSDHGELLGDHGFFFKSLVAYEESIRVPFLVRHPGRIAAGTRSDAPLSLVDLAPSFAALAGVPADHRFEGIDQVPHWTGGGPVRDEVIIEERPGDRPWNQRILVRGRWKLALYAGRPWGELYDIGADPHHVRNLWDDPAHRPVRDELCARILAHEMNKRHPNPGDSAAAALAVGDAPRRWPHVAYGVMDLDPR